jgi:hypothetical protein
LADAPAADHDMSKLLSARDLLDLVRLGDNPERDNIEVIVGPQTLGRRVYAGTTERRARRPIAQHPQMPRRDTLKITPEQRSSALSKAQAQALRHGSSAARGADDRTPAIPPRASQPPGAEAPSKVPARPPSDLGVGPDEPTPTWDLEPAPRGDAGTPFAAAGLAGDRPEAEEVPGAKKHPKTGWGRPVETPSNRPPSVARVARLTPAKPIEATRDPSLERFPSSGLPVPGISLPMPGLPVPGVHSGPIPPLGTPLGVPLSGGLPVPGLTGPLPSPGGDATPSAAPMRARESVPDSNQRGSTPDDPAPKSAVASMFSWVTQRADWAPAKESLDVPPATASEPPPPPEPPPAPLPPPIPRGPAPVAASRSIHDGEPRSLQSDERIALTGEETVVLLNFDPTLPVESLAERTGLSEFRVNHLVASLRRRGVLDDDGSADEPAPSSAPPSSARQNQATLVDLPAAFQLSAEAPPSSRSRAVEAAPSSAERPAQPSVLRMDEQGQLSSFDSNPTILEMDLNELSRLEGLEDATYVDEGLAPPSSRPHSSTTGVASRAAAPASEVAPASVPAPAAPPEEPDASRDSEDADSPEAENEDEKASAVNYLAHYERVLAPLDIDQRTRVATIGSGMDLYALAYEKDHNVFRNLWDNVNITHEHARFAAFHHRTAAGLDTLAQRGEFFKDPQVQRRILRNPMISETLLRRILLPKRLIDIYKTSLDRDAGERTRSSARNLLRNKFATTDSDDRMELIWKTEGRALGSLSGLSIDSKTATLICARQIMSVSLVQNFTRFAATPPSVISHFLKQPIVKRQIHLRNALLKHPNCPSDAKRAF